MEFGKLITERRSVRAYKDERPSAELIETILKEAQAAPSWKNSQTARTYTACSDVMIAKAWEKLPSFNQKSSHGAALIVTSFVKGVSGFTNGEPDNAPGDCWGAYDLGLHDAYLILAAKNHDLDTLIMGLRDEDGLREVFGIPDNEQIMSVIAIGYRDQEPQIRPRKDLKDVSFIG